MAVILPFTRDAVSATSMAEAGQQHALTSDRAVDDARWAALMLLAQDGDKDAYRVLLQSIAPYVRAIARRYLGRGEDAEDAVQEVLMVVHGIRHTFERGRPFKPWLGTIASRRCIDQLRRRTHRARHEMADVVDVDYHAHGDLGPEDTLQRHQEARQVRRVVEELPVRQRDAISMLRLQELSLNEASEQSRQTVGSLKVACHRAMGSLQRALARKDHPND
ncbi:MAG: sigma-70 family RNA polymerase sigma factor [Pseudomonadota bacterium]|nr:sigma-70 family RNA polymerase sigma factor [Pseudomonadota bacterium]MDQ3160157.1 sigma-70 family RNA polymerase sigma factor [Pseudomonadota bacterium]